MATIKFIGTWCKHYQEMLDIPKGYLVFKYKDFYRKPLGKALLPIDERQHKKLNGLIEKSKIVENIKIDPEDYLTDLEIEITYHYKKRTLDQNALMWSLYEIEANEMNGGQSGHKEQIINTDDLYYGDLNEYAERETIITHRSNLMYYLSEYKVIESVTHKNRIYKLKDFLQIKMNLKDDIKIRALRGTSKLNKKEMAHWIDRIFNRLAYNGVPISGGSDILKYWNDWKLYLNENKIILHDTIMTQEEYKSFNPICEACGEFISEGEGDLSHIKAIGMGGDRTKEPRKNYTSNWLHLHREPCHLTDWHKAGYKSFIKKYRHLMYKVTTALSRDYEPIDEVEDPTELKELELF